VTGKVVDQDDKPVSGAEIVHFPIDGNPTIAGKSDAKGAFSVTVSLKSPGAWLFARSPGFGSNFLMPAVNTPAEVTFKLVKDAPIRARVIDTQGKPVVGASVVVSAMAGTNEESLDRFLAGWLKRDPSQQEIDAKGSVSWDISMSRKLPDGREVFGATTDQDGRFAIANIGSERIVTFNVRGAGIANAQILVIARTGFQAAAYNQSAQTRLREDNGGLGYHPMFFPPAADIVAESEKPIRGIVKESDTGKPVAGAAVRLKQGFRTREPEPSAVTDANGQYEIRGAKKADSYELYVNRNMDRGLLGRTVKFGDNAALEPINGDISMARGIILTGRVLDTTTGKPVPGFACIGVLADNEFVKKPEFSSPDCYDFANTNKEGEFRTIVPPGPILLMGGPHPDGNSRDVYFKYQQLRPDPDYPQYFDMQLTGFRSPGGVTTIMQGMYCKVLKLKPDQKEVSADVLLKQASTFRVKIQDKDGKPLSGAMAAGNTARDWMYPEICKGDTCIVYDLENAKPRLLAFHVPGADLVGTLTLKGDEKEPIAVRLGPTARAKGKVVNQSGQPIANLRLQVSYFDRVADEIDRSRGGTRHATIDTDANGKFEVAEMIPGMKFLFYGRRGGKYLEPPKRTREAAFTAKAGEIADLGKVVLKDE
jgi:Carboxypeptidase regulatory-like domain